jgi:hypothetical protein
MNENNFNETIYGVKESYLNSYLGAEDSRKTLPRWKKCEDNHNINFNIAAFFLDVIWYFYKGVYKAGFIFLAVMLIVPNVLGIAAGIISMKDTISYYNEHVVVYGVQNAAAQAGVSSYVSAFSITFIIASLIIKLVCALYFDYLYFRKIKYCVFYEIAGMKDVDDDESVNDCLSRAKKHRDTKEKGLRNGIVIGYVIVYFLRFIF